jgi:hypothetical protein
MKKRWLLVFLLLLSVYLFKTASPLYAADGIKIQITPIACLGNTCPDIMRDQVYNQLNPPESCATSYEDFLTAPQSKHFWAEDPAITAQGKADERARQFIYWVLNNNAIDNHPIIKAIWNTTSSMAFIFMVLVAAVMSLGFIVAQRANFQLNIKVWPFFSKLAISFLYIFFSWLIVISLIQIADWVMKLFIDNLGGNNLFNVYFNSASGSSEQNYTSFVGCRDLNIRVQEGADTEILLFKITNITYYIMGIMLILRKILLWFLLFVSPFLAILFPFVFIRNIGWVWIGVFFQWLCYGPLFALFLGALNQMWKVGIPFTFNFSRVNDIKGYVFPTALILTYGGPAQRGSVQAIGALNNGNYVDTFVEYVITLIMLWAVIFFPWWLLHIFRDYCCDGIYAMKNILLSMYDQMRGSPTPGSPSPQPPTLPSMLGGNLQMQTPRDVTIPVKIKIETIEEIKRTRTDEITKSLNLSASKLTDIARFETNKSVQENVSRNLNYLSNPAQASTPNERQKYMNIRTELFNRAIKNDTTARQILSATSSSTIERIQKRDELLKTTPQAAGVSSIVSSQTNISKDKVSSINNSLVTTITNNTNIVNTMSQNTNLPAQQVQNVLTSYQQNINTSPIHTVSTISHQTGLAPEKVRQVIKQIRYVAQTNVNNNLVSAIQNNAQEVSTVAQATQATPAQVKSILEKMKTNPQQAENNIDQIATAAQVEKEKVSKIIHYVQQVAQKNKQLVKEVAVKENINEEDVQKVVDAQVPLVEPDEAVTKAISIPPTVSIEDYEEVKKMWTNQYEKGEVPVSVDVQSREEWLDQDIIFITNTLNKLLSTDPQLRQEAMDEIGYILPIFIINNLKGDELMVYLKAKLEAAKSVKENLQKIKDLTNKLKSEADKDEDLVEVDRSKTESAQKEMHMSEEMPESGADEKTKDLDAQSTPLPSEMTKDNDTNGSNSGNNTGGSTP